MVLIVLFLFRKMGMGSTECAELHRTLKTAKKTGKGREGKMNEGR